MKRYLLGVDNGGTYIKAALFDINGKQCYLEKLLSMADNDGYGRSERNQQILWENNCKCIRNLLVKSGIQAEEIAGVAFAGQGKGLYCVDKNGGSIRPAITSADVRAQTIAEQLNDDVKVRQLKLHICQDIHAYQPLAILKWMSVNESHNYQKIRWIFSMKDYLNFRMTGVAVTDYSSQSGSPFINFTSGQYDAEIFYAAGIADKISAMPPLKWPCEICGYVTRTAHEMTGLAVGTPVSVGMFDVNACALAMGVLRDDTVFMITGTWSINAYVAKRPVMNGLAMFNSLYFVPGYYQIEEGSPTSAGVLEWAIPLLYPNANDMDGNIYEWINAEISTLSYISPELFFLPFVYGTVDSNRACGAWIGLNAHTSRGEMLAALYEGVAFGHRYHVERLQKSCGSNMKYRLAGGVTNSEIWMQIFTDVLNKPIEILDTSELGALGAAISVGIAVGIYKNYKAAVQNCVSVKKVLYPDVGSARILEEKYQKFKHYVRMVSEE